MGTWSTSRRSLCLFIGLVNLLVLVNCRADNKDPSLLLRPPGSSSSVSGSGPVFSSSIDSIPVSSGSSNQQTVFKSPSYVHSSASASASAGGGLSEQIGGGGRHNSNNSPWYNGNNGNSGYSFELNEGGSGGNIQSHTSVTSTGVGNGYYEQPPAVATHQVPSTASADNYGPPNGGAQGPSYTYFYQHYPTSSNQGGWGGGGGDDGGHGNLFGDLSLPGLGGGGLGIGGGAAAVKVVKIAAAIVKGIIAAKPILIIALLLLLALPILLFIAPIPIITISQPAILRSARSSSEKFTSYLSTLSGKVLNAEECLERIICKLPQPPEKYQKKAKLLWDEHGSKMVSNQRVVRGLNAYFDSSSQKNRNLKCEQRFKCSNKYL